MSHIKNDLEEKDSLINPNHFTKKTYTSPEITPIIMNDVIAGGIVTLNEGQSGTLS